MFFFVTMRRSELRDRNRIYGDEYLTIVYSQGESSIHYSAELPFP